MDDEGLAEAARLARTMSVEAAVSTMMKLPGEMRACYRERGSKCEARE